jgi:hypothetical protein
MNICMFLKRYRCFAERTRLLRLINGQGLCAAAFLLKWKVLGKNPGKYFSFSSSSIMQLQGHYEVKMFCFWVRLIKSLHPSQIHVPLIPHSALRVNFKNTARTNKAVFPIETDTYKPQVKYGVRSPKFIWAPVYSCAHWLRPRNHPAYGLIYEGAIGQLR